MATIITREVGATAKGTPLTNAELDNNFVNLNSELATKANTNNPTFTGTVVAPALSIPTNTTPAVFTKDDNLTAWDYSGKSTATTGETGPSGIFFKPDGLVMYITGTGQDVNQYSLSVAWDVSTAAFVQASASLGDTSPTGIFFKPDGLAMFVAGATGDVVRQFSLSVAWDVSTLAFVQQISITDQESSIQDVWFKPDGTKMYFVGSSGDDINEYNLSTAWNVSTAVFVRSFSVGAQDSGPVAVVFSPDGTKMYMLGTAGQDINRYTLSTAWDISTAVFFNNFYIGFQETSPTGLFINFVSNTAYVVGSNTDKVYQYSTLTDGIELVSESVLFVQGSLYTNKNLVVTSGTRIDGLLNLSGAATLSSTLTVGGTATLNGAVTMPTTTGAITIGTSQSTGTTTIGGTAQTGLITVGRSTGTQTLDLAAGATTAVATKTVNIGTAGVSGSTTNINIGSAVSGSLGTTTLNSRLTTPFQITSTLATGTPPLVVESTTRVANLNVATAGNADTVTDGVYTTGDQTIAGTKTFTTATSFTNVGNQLLIKNGTANDSTVIHRKDGADYYILLSNASTTPNQTWNTLRPFVINQTTGLLTSQNGQSFNGGTTVANTLNSTGILKAAQILQGVNTFVRDYASGYSTTVAASTLYEIGRLTFTGNSQNVTIVGEIRGGSGSSVGVNRFILTIRTDTLPGKTFQLFEEETTDLGRIINIRVYHDTVSGLVVIGYTTNSSLQNIGWSLRVQERGDYNYLQQTTTLTTLNTTGLTEVTPTSTVRTISSTLTVPNGITANVTGNATNVTGVVALANGGSGQTTAQSAINAFAGAVTAGQYLRGDGTNVIMSAIQASDVPNLDAAKITSGTIDAARLPSYVDDVVEAANLASFPVTGETGKIYVALDTNKAYRWSGTVYVYITSGAVDSVAGRTGIVTLTSTDVGLGNVDNKSSATIRGEITSSNVTTALGFTPLSNAVSYLPLTGGTLTGNLTAPTLYSSGTTYYLAPHAALTAQSTTAGSRIGDLRFDTLWKELPASSGPILTYTLTSAGTGYTDGAYTNIVLSGGQGVYATFDFTVVDGVVTVATLTERGSGFQVGNTIAITALGGTGSGGLITVNTVRTVDLSLSGTTGRIRLASNDSTTAAGQELGGIYFNARDGSVGGAGDKAYILGVASGTSGGGDLQFWTSANGGAPSLAVMISGNNDFRLYNSTGTFYHTFSNAPTANITLTLPNYAGTLAVIGTANTAGFFYTGTTTPTGSTRLNYSGNFHPTAINIGAIGDTTTAATHYFVETASDGFIRPKTLANVRTELVTSTAIATAMTSADLRVDSLGVGTAASGVTGEIRATNNITGFYSSDRSLKENIRNITGALDKLQAINGVMFDWKQAYIQERGGEDGYFVRKADTGVIAQEVELVLPEVVGTRENGIKAVAYEKLVPLLIEAIKELKIEVDELRAKVK